MRIKGLHHHAVRCRDSEETRKFYEDFLGLPFVGALEIKESKSGRKTNTLHTFYQMADGSHLAFFEAPDMSMGKVTVNLAYVNQKLEEIADDEDLSRFIL